MKELLLILASIVAISLIFVGLKNIQKNQLVGTQKTIAILALIMLPVFGFLLTLNKK